MYTRRLWIDRFAAVGLGVALACSGGAYAQVGARIATPQATPQTMMVAEKTVTPKTKAIDAACTRMHARGSREWRQCVIIMNG